MIKPFGSRIIVRLLPRYSEEENKINLILVDKQKHYQGVRRGIVEGVSDSVHSVKLGDVVVIPGDRGDSFGMTEYGANDGVEWRRLRVSEVLAVEEQEPVKAGVAEAV
jgi:co-chaperonin GroES (HSP10)